MAANDTKNYINQLSIDCVIFGYQDNELRILIPKLNLTGDLWCLPSGFICQEEGVDEAAHRILEERTGIRNVYLDQFRVFGDVPRNNKEVIDQLADLNQLGLLHTEIGEEFLEWLKNRFISIGYYALVKINEVVPTLGVFDESAEWYTMENIPKMILDHNEIVKKALEALRVNFDNQLIGFNLLPDRFTMKELQQVYEAVYAKPFRSNNFQKKMLDLNVLERMEKKFTGAANKAPYLYQFKS
jgi:8-oxo-dGTP diphosphatase